MCNPALPFFPSLTPSLPLPKSLHSGVACLTTALFFLPPHLVGFILPRLDSAIGQLRGSHFFLEKEGSEDTVHLLLGSFSEQRRRKGDFFLIEAILWI